MIKIAEQDIIFLSYDEPNAEENWADLKRKVPWAKRVHGVEGSDAAHKACADLSDTKHFVTVDGDTIIDPKFMEVVLDLDKLGIDDDYQFSWCGKIDVNGLMYGNGSLKMWTKEFVKNMQTHENTDGTDKTSIEFCYFDNYYQLNQNYSTSIISSTPQQAWRAGFREGVKMSLDQGKIIKDFSELWWQNYHRLLVWMQVGADVRNGLWTIMGAREGCYKTMLTDWDHTEVQWFDNLERIYNEFDPMQMPEINGALMTRLGLPILEFDANASKFFKKYYAGTYFPSSPMMSEMEIVRKHEGW